MARKKKLKMNPPPGTVPLVVGTLVIGLTAGGLLLYSSQKPSGGKKKNECSPYKFVTADVRRSIEAEINAGERDPAKVAVNVATEHFGMHPSGGTVTFPPDDSNAKKGVVCVWNKTVLLVAEIFDERGITDDPNDDGGVEIVIHDPYDEGYPWEEASIETNNYPTPGMFADVGAESDFDYSQGPMAVATAAINAALAMASSRGLDVSRAQSYMSEGASSAKRRDLVKQMAQAIGCSKWNDALYGVTVPAAEVTSPDNWYGWLANKRHLLYLPQHNDVLAMMAVGEQPRRAITATGSHKSGNTRRQPVWWIPAINLDRLAGPNPVITTNGMKWSDGSSTQEPPPVVARLGVNPNGVSLPGGFGCK